MKQHITVEQLQSLSDSHLIRLHNLIYDEDIDLKCEILRKIDVFKIKSNNGIYVHWFGLAELVSIGKMIEVLIKIIG